MGFNSAFKGLTVNFQTADTTSQEKRSHLEWS